MCQDIGDIGWWLGWRRAECRDAAPPDLRVAAAIVAAVLDSDQSPDGG
jgi:hypothetical protein